MMICIQIVYIYIYIYVSLRQAIRNGKNKYSLSITTRLPLSLVNLLLFGGVQ